MKRIIFVLFLAAFGSLLFAADEPESLVIQKTFQIHWTKAELYDRSLQWMAKTCRATRDVILYQNPSSGMIIGKLSTSISYDSLKLGRGPTYFTFTIETKDNSIRVTVDHAYCDVLSGDYITYSVVDAEDGYTKNFVPAATKIIASLVDYLSTSEVAW